MKRQDSRAEDELRRARWRLGLFATARRGVEPAGLVNFQTYCWGLVDGVHEHEGHPSLGWRERAVTPFH